VSDVRNGPRCKSWAALAQSQAPPAAVTARPRPSLQLAAPPALRPANAVIQLPPAGCPFTLATGRGATPRGRLRAAVPSHTTETRDMTRRTRRQFLRDAGLAGVGFWAAGGLSPAADTKDSPNGRLNI